MNKVLAIIGNVLALFIYGVGLLSPLTPSEGLPTIGSLITFVGLPLAFLVNAWRGYSHPLPKYAVAFQGLLILAFTGRLFLLQAGAL